MNIFLIFSVKTIESNPSVSAASSTLLIRQTSIDQNNESLLEHESSSRPSSIHPITLRSTTSPNEDDINVHKRHPKQYSQRSVISRPGSRWQLDSARMSRLAMNSEFETDSSLSYHYSSSMIKLKIAIRVKPAPQEFSVCSGLPGVAPQVKPAELEVYVESAKNIPLGKLESYNMTHITKKGSYYNIIQSTKNHLPLMSVPQFITPNMGKPY